eukprot:CAMPEP_0185271176 /NCGR_PEP_ID=MMETSP1359-20130426/44113_1 /TAXON_ID=552665 /ORGANISM="Bigelowiella longifila, Strain CCMP242" /LENGTH=118 /DNA_ID=CAMNT_0027863025 /DNA_START=51 /DNA_END=407 /DNA_ORIENTATION=+
MVKELLKRFPDQIDQKSQEPLEQFAGDIGLIADTDIIRDSGYTALMLAVMFGPPASVKAFLDAGADMECKTDHGSSVLEFAQYRDDAQIRCLFEIKSTNDNPETGPFCKCDSNKCVII